MKYVFDGIIIAVLILFTVIGAKKGFIKAAADLLGGIVSMIAAGMLSGKVSEYIYGKVFAEAVENKVRNAIEMKGMNVKEYFEELPEFIARWLDFTGINAETVGERVSESAASTAEVVSESLAPVFIGLINVFVVIILFLLFMIIIKAIANLLTGLFHLPLLKEVNGVLGAVLGLFLGVLVIWLAVGAIGFFHPMMEAESQQKLSAMVADSTICEMLVDLNPVRWIYE